MIELEHHRIRPAAIDAEMLTEMTDDEALRLGAPARERLLHLRQMHDPALAEVCRMDRYAARRTPGADPPSV